MFAQYIMVVLWMAQATSYKNSNWWFSYHGQKTPFSGGMIVGFLRS